MVDRRTVLRSFAVGAVILGFDLSSRTWVTSANAATLDTVPPLDGTFTLDTAARQADSTDQGNIVVETPAAVLRPGSVTDIEKMVAFSAARGIKVAPRGAHHTTYGQGLVDNGLIIEMESLNTIHSIGPSGADVDSGVLWRTLVEQANTQGLRVAGLTGYLGLTIGGVLSVGGASENYKEGGIVDRVQQVEVVTGTGARLLCSPAQNADLFNAVLAGLGQCGIITRVWLDLLPAPQRIRWYQLSYTSNAAFFKDLRLLANRGEMDALFGLWQPIGTSLTYQLQAMKYYDSTAPDDKTLLRGLSYVGAPVLPLPVPAVLPLPVAPAYFDQTYLDNVKLFDQAIENIYKPLGWDHVKKPWFDVWLPDSTVEQYLGEVIPSLTPEDWSPTSFILLFIHKRSAFQRPFFRVPDDPQWVYLFDILNDSTLNDPAALLGVNLPINLNPNFVQDMLTRNRRLFEKARSMGGTRYPIGSIEFSQSDWQQQYGPQWSTFLNYKKRFDPQNILTPGPKIF